MMQTPTARDQQGFTLLEIMTVVMMIAIIATIALPSYTEYARRGAQAESQALMLAISEDLGRYRGKNLTYRGYTFEDGLSTDNRVFYAPRGSSLTNYKYKIELVDGVDRSVSLSNSTRGQQWFMVATPNLSNSVIKTSHYLMLTSTGLRCKTRSTLTINSVNCGVDNESW